MKKIIFLSIFVFVFVVTPLYADKVILKDGKSVQGRILERTKDYVRIDYEGLPLTYYMDDVQNIEETPEKQAADMDAQVSPYSGSSGTGSSLASPWLEWRESVKDYLIRTVLLQSEGYKEIKVLFDEFSKPRENGMVAVDDAILSGASEKMNKITAELSQLIPIKEFEVYHGKLIDFFKNLKQSIEALRQLNVSSAKTLANDALAAYMESVRELRTIFIRHQAPEAAISPFDEDLQAYDAMKNQEKTGSGAAKSPSRVNR